MEIFGKILILSTLLSCCISQYSPGSGGFTPALGATPLQCIDISNYSLPFEADLPGRVDVIQIKFDVLLNNVAYDLTYCVENFELTVGNSTSVPSLLNWTIIQIKPSSNGAGLMLDMHNNSGTDPTLRDNLRFSNDSLLCMYLDPYPVLGNLSLTYTMKYETNTALQTNITVEERIDDRFRWNETSRVLDLPYLNLVSGLRLRTKRDRETGDWVRECVERVVLTEMCYLKEEAKGGGDHGGWIAAGVVAVLVAAAIIVYSILPQKHKDALAALSNAWDVLKGRLNRN